MTLFFNTAGSLWLALVFFALLFLQWQRPLRRQHFVAARRVVRNFVFAIPAFFVLRIALIPMPLAAAHWAQQHGVGLFNIVALPPFWEGAVAIVLFDYAYYWWHVATHRVPLLWRFHNVHHTDLDMDVSTATRFHGGELVLSVPFRVLVVLLLGIAPLALLFFEIVFESAGQFHHSNWRLPIGVERALQKYIVTPRMHGIHHSIVRDETDSNWGTMFSCWDKLHRTQRIDVPQDAITIGVPAYRDEQELSLGDLWKMPFQPLRDWKLPDGSQPQRASRPASDLAE